MILSERLTASGTAFCTIIRHTITPLISEAFFFLFRSKPVSEEFSITVGVISRTIACVIMCECERVLLNGLTSPFFRLFSACFRLKVVFYYRIFAEEGL